MDTWILFGISSGLSLVAGTNAYAPLLSLAISARWGQTEIHPLFSFLTSDWCIAILVLCVLVNFFADKIPGVSAVWNTIHTILKPVVGISISFAIIAPHDYLTFTFTACGLFFSLFAALIKLSLRSLLSLWTAGLSNPVIGLLEDVFAVVGIVLSFITPFVMLTLALVVLIIFLAMSKRFLGMVRYQWYFARWFFGRGRNTGPLTPHELSYLVQKITPPPTIFTTCQTFWLTQTTPPRKPKRIMRTIKLIIIDSALVLLTHKTKAFPILAITAIQKVVLQPKRSYSVLYIQANNTDYQLIINKQQNAAMLEIVTILQDRYHLPCQIYTDTSTKIFASQ